MNSSARVLALADVHLGHRKTSSFTIIDNLRSYFLPQIEGSDLILIAGDFFDRLLSLPSEEVEAIHQFIGDFLMLAREKNVIVRVLEGTPSHDWQQSRLFEQINKLGIYADVKWFASLDIEYIEKLGTYILYIPDEWDHIEAIYEQARQLLYEFSLQKADWIVMHGQFDFQLPKAHNIPKHSSERYQQLAHYYTICGHVHRPTQKGNILIPGSFDRLAHGEEEAKGFYRIDTDPDRVNDRITFIENETAKTFKTIDLRGVDKERCWQILERDLAFVEANSHISILLYKDDPLRDLADELKKRYPLLHFDLKSEQVGQSSFDQLEKMKPEQLEPITPNTIERLVGEKLTSKGVDENLYKRALEELKQWI